MLQGLNLNAAQPFPLNTEMFTEQRQRLAGSMRAAGKAASVAAFLQGGSEVPINSSEWNYYFVQEPFFYYLFGTELPDCFGFVLHDGTGLLFIPRVPAENETWLGALPTPQSVQRETGVEECHYVEDMARVLKDKGLKTLEVLEGIITDSDRPVVTAKLPFSSADFTLSTGYLFEALSRQRVYKTKLEAEVLKYVGLISSNAHIRVMQSTRPGKSQHQIESTFLHEVYHNGGCRRVSYPCICPTGHHNATLHYPYNDKPIEDGTMALLDMGGNYRGYAADITCSFPVNGRFTEKQKLIYNAVLDAHDRVLRAIKPGVSWVDMHKLAIRTTCEHLQKAGVFKKTASIDDLMKAEVMRYFQPHGLGHLIGIEVHDVGAYLDHCPPRPTAKDAAALRTARVLEEGVYITVEPGCYFNAALIEKALNDDAVKDMIDREVLLSFSDFGGVRIESDVLVTYDGATNFTCVPRTVEEVEAVMAGKPFQKEIEVFKNA